MPPPRHTCLLLVTALLMLAMVSLRFAVVHFDWGTHIENNIFLELRKTLLKDYQAKTTKVFG